MIKMALCFQLLYFVCFVLAHSKLEVVDLDHRFFLMHIMEKYGHNGTITYEGFERLYRNLGLGNTHQVDKDRSTVTVNSNAGEGPKLARPERNIGNFNTSKECKSQQELAELIQQHDEVLPHFKTHPSPAQHCLSPHELLAVYGLRGPAVTLSPVTFLHLCPAIIYELDQHTCVWGGGGHQQVVVADENSTHSRWLFASLAVLLISVSGLISVALVQLLHKSLINQLLSFLVALAVGTLLGDAFLHLIPHALESHGVGEGHSNTDSVMKTGLMFLTVVFFFTFEAVLNIFRNRREKQRKQDNVSYVSVYINQNEKEIMEMGGSHMHSHSHSLHNTALMVIMGDGLHNLTDGLAIGAAFTGGLAPGFATAVAVFTHELPHELGDFAVLLQSGLTVRQALLYNLLSSALSFLGTAIGLVIGNFEDSTRWIYAITAGSFIYIALSNLVPEINREKSNWAKITLRLSGILCGGGLMGCIALYEHDIQHLFL